MSSSMIFGVLLVSLTVVLAKPATGDEKHAPTLPGPCPDFKAVSSMEGLKLDGEWFGTHVAKQGLEKKGTIKCVKKSVTMKSDGKIDSLMSAIKDGQQKSKTVHATPIAGKTGKFTLQKDTTDASESNISKTGTLVYVDDKCLCEVICGENGTHNGYIVGVFSRASTLDDASLEKVKSALTAAGINVTLEPVAGC